MSTRPSDRYPLNVNSKNGCEVSLFCLMEPGFISMDDFVGWVPTVLFLIGYALFVACFFCRDVLYLRALAVIGQIALIPYYIALFGDGYSDVSGDSALIVGQFSPHIGLICTAVLVVVNLVYICLILNERRPIRLSSMEKTLYELVFSSISTRDFRRLFSLGKIISLKRSELLVSRDSASEMLYLIADGTATVELSPGQTKELVTGHFIGELSFITGGLTSADVRAGRDETLVLAWTHRDLAELLNRNPVLSHAFDLILSFDVSGKLTRMNVLEANV